MSLQGQSGASHGEWRTYSLNGKQYVVVAIGPPNYSAELVAYRLPE